MMGARLGATLVLAVCLAACAAPMAPVVTSPKFPAYPRPDAPAGLRIGPIEQAQHERAWQWLQAGDPRRAAAEFAGVLARAPGFYPAEAGLGFAHLANRQYADAAARLGVTHQGTVPHEVLHDSSQRLRLRPRSRRPCPPR